VAETLREGEEVGESDEVELPDREGLLDALTLKEGVGDSENKQLPRTGSQAHVVHQAGGLVQWNRLPDRSDTR